MGSIIYQKDGGVGIVTLAKPPHNLMDNALLDALATVYARALGEGCRALLLRSSMRHFCAGADLGTIAGGTRDHNALKAIWESLESVPIPTVAAVHGAALGGGFELALMCDIVVAADTASFGMVEVSLGLLPLLGGVQRVVQRAGLARAKEMAMLGRRQDPRTLERWGVINQVVPESELQTVSMSWARQLAAGPTVAIKSIKVLANATAATGTVGADGMQEAVNSMMWKSGDQARGLAAFSATGSSG